MASPIHGRSGRLYVGLASGSAAAEPVANLREWKISFDVDSADTTVFGDTNKTSVAGLPNASGSFAGFYDSGGAQLYTAASDGAARRFYIYPTTASTGTYWFGTGTFGFDVEGAVDDVVKVSGDFDASSPVAKVG